MVHFEKYSLKNGLTVLLHFDPSTPMVAVNTLYDVGARDESEAQTGFAHLFEHLMFGGSINIPDFDGPLQNAGGESNAFTSNDITNYYNILPKENIETALWLESDRMLSLAFTDKSLEVQRQVVIEEFKQRYLNQPYGDVWLQLRPLAYKVHPYKWATIGKELAHIENATMEDVRSFFKRFYFPANAILCVAGNFSQTDIKEQIEKYFGDIPSPKKPARILPKEPEQKEYRVLEIERDVPGNAFYFAFKMQERRNPEYYIADVLSDYVGREKSSKLYIRLKKELQMVTEISAYITGSFDDGLLIISGKLSNNVEFNQFEKEFWKTIEEIRGEKIEEEEMTKLLNKIKTSKEFQEQGLLNRAMNLSYFEVLGDANGINEELSLYSQIKANHLEQMSKFILKKENCSLLKVKSKESC